jgi:hypothetical protein
MSVSVAIEVQPGLEVTAPGEVRGRSRTGARQCLATNTTADMGL